MNRLAFILCMLSGCAVVDQTTASKYHYQVTTLASSGSTQPWRKSPRQGARSTWMARDFNQHFLDTEDWINDKSARRYTMRSLKARRPNQSSVTSQITLFNIAAYLGQVIRPSITQWGIKISQKILAGQDLYRLVTPMFLHGGIVHLFTNTMSFGRVGPDLENFFGPGRFLATYLVSGVAGNLMSAYMSPNPSLGASGAVFGVMSAYVVFLTRHEWLFGMSGDDLSTSVGSTMLVNIVYGALMPMIDNWGHLGGAIGGAAMAYYFGPNIYMSDLPDGTRVMIDRPIYRLPRQIESLPGNVFNRLDRVARRMQVIRYKQDMRDTPWRRQGQPIRRSSPNRSIKPRPPVDF